MTTAKDVAAYILELTGPITAMKLQKLVYYSQAWTLVWDEEPLFEEDIQAWIDGPVVYSLYNEHRGKFRLSRTDIDGDGARLTDAQKENIRIVVDYYGGFTAQQLSELTHREEPWREAREGIPANQRASAIISKGSMASYYSGVAATHGQTA